MYLDYLDFADQLNETLQDGKIYVWQNRMDGRKYGVEIWCRGKVSDVAVNIKRRDIIENVRKAYGIISDKLGITPSLKKIALRNKVITL